jgi:parafibromin
MSSCRETTLSPSSDRGTIPGSSPRLPRLCSMLSLCSTWTHSCAPFLFRPRVICVLTTGQAWQFKGYKWTDPKELFHHGSSLSPSLYPSLLANALYEKLTPVRIPLTVTVKGIYFHWTNSPPAPSIKDWNVAALQVCLPCLPPSLYSSFDKEMLRSSLCRGRLVQVEPTKRHVDRALVAQFWRIIDNFRPSS